MQIALTVTIQKKYTLCKNSLQVRVNTHVCNIRLGGFERQTPHVHRHVRVKSRSFPATAPTPAIPWTWEYKAGDDIHHGEEERGSPLCNSEKRF